mmetsp:Transcript_154549/g.494292  ORF Transcript_154549/g.494292 Transcript_154549/m.494292 type:complete len:224 (+) Transcript_154549:166-837(+)
MDLDGSINQVLTQAARSPHTGHTTLYRRGVHILSAAAPANLPEGNQAVGADAMHGIVCHVRHAVKGRGSTCRHRGCAAREKNPILDACNKRRKMSCSPSPANRAHLVHDEGRGASRALPQWSSGGGCFLAASRKTSTTWLFSVPSAWSNAFWPFSSVPWMLAPDSMSVVTQPSCCCMAAHMSAVSPRLVWASNGHFFSTNKVTSTLLPACTAPKRAVCPSASW